MKIIKKLSVRKRNSFKSEIVDRGNFISDSIKVACPSELNYLRPQIVHDLTRIGNFKDGGYAVPISSILDTKSFLSLGLGENWSFEKNVSEINSKAKIDIFDHTVSANLFLLKFIKGFIKYLILKDSYENLRSRLNRLCDYFSFWRRNPRNTHHKIRIDRESFKYALSNYPKENLIGLKIDIEGAEWDILDLIIENKSRFEFILLEVHDFNLHENELKTFINCLTEDFLLAHLHANNFEGLGTNGFPRVFEITLLKRKVEFHQEGHRSQLPVVGLDAPNAKNRPDFVINFG
jgi:hypothetical protein